MFFKKDERYRKWIQKYKNFKGYEKAWIDNKRLWVEEVYINPPLFPIIIIGKYKNKVLIDKVESFNDIFNPDYIGYEWEPDEFIIDSRGNKYEVDYIDMYHPVGFVYPSKIVKQLSLSEVKDLLIGDENIEKTNNLLCCQSISEIINEIEI